MGMTGFFYELTKHKAYTTDWAVDLQKWVSRLGKGANSHFTLVDKFAHAYCAGSASSCSDANIKHAQKALMQEFDVVGITEHYDESLAMLSCRLNWPIGPFWYDHKLIEKKKQFS